MAEVNDRLLALLARRVDENVAVNRALVREYDTCVRIAGELIRAYKAGNKMIIFGNGGSSADAQHIATELVGRYYLERPSVPAVALTASTTSITAIGNDYTFDEVYARQLQAFGQPGDVAIGLTTSGTSKNVLVGLRAAKQLGMVTVALTGDREGVISDVADYRVRVPSTDTPRIQEAHLLIGHILCELVEAALFAPQEA